jgi:hypothetical protein
MLKNVINFIDIKECTSCKTYKNIDQFHFRSKEKNILHSKCSQCTSVSRKNKVKSNSNTSFLEQPATTLSKNSMFDPASINEILAQHEDSKLKDLLLSILKYAIGSSTGYNIKEELVANVLNLNHSKEIGGPDAHDSLNQPWEIKTNFVAMSGNRAITAGGKFNDITEEKIKQIPKYKMAVGIFVDHYLLAIGTFPGSWGPFMERIEKRYQTSKNKKGRVCAEFYYNDWRDCPDLEWAVLPDVKSLIAFKSKMTQKMFDDLIEACTSAMEKDKAHTTSRSKKANIQGLGDV